ncbi:MAG TPA: alpha/beta fold hydrolase [Pseudonocardiaceae bacterium]|nr:alpha/beta fold hydrolase [Pseudonocardiaceae bacterium]
MVEANGITLYYETHGDGPPLVLILGLGADVSVFQPFVRDLAAHHRVLAFDNRGAGRSAKPREPYTVPMMADDTAGLIQAVGMAGADVMGLSLGGRIAIELAVRHPELVGRLVLVSTAARVIRTPRRFLVMHVLTRIRRGGGRYPQPRYAFVRQRQAAERYDGRPALSRIHVPTVILHGRADRSTPFFLAEELRDGIAGSTLVPFTGGHRFLLSGDERQRFHDELAAFLAT